MTEELEKNFEGYWGKPTSTLDWCEANYEVSYYVAEFWNTISNFFMIVPPIIAAILAKIDGLETRFIGCHIGLFAVGVGSWCFHGTLLYEMQLLDELPMIWGTAVMVYTLAEMTGRPKSHNRILQVGLFLYASVVTVVYLTIKEPIFHQVAYALMVTTLLVLSCRIVRYYEHSKVLYIVGVVSYGTGFIFWNIDNIFCKNLREIRHGVGSKLSPLFQGHAWWHVGAGIGTYTLLLFSTHARMKYLKRPLHLKVGAGVFPYIRATEEV